MRSCLACRWIPLCCVRVACAFLSSKTQFIVPLLQVNMPVAHTFTPRVLGYCVCTAAVIISAFWVNFRAYHVIRTGAPDVLVLDWNEKDFGESS